ncbi:MAG: hypothetical protein Kow0031_34650 [Anaerolineae bacterium]
MRAGQLLKAVAKWSGITLLVLLGLALQVAMVPVSTTGLTSRAKPAAGYDEALYGRGRNVLILRMPTTA